MHEEYVIFLEKELEKLHGKLISRNQSQFILADCTLSLICCVMGSDIRCMSNQTIS
jgi:hypothetical protein